MAQIDISELLRRGDHTSAICQMDSENPVFTPADMINGDTGQMMPSTPGAHAGGVCRGSFIVLTPLNDQVLRGKRIEYAISRGFDLPKILPVPRQGRFFSPFNLKGQYLCVVRWFGDDTSVNHNTVVYLITPSYRDALMEWISKHDESSVARIFPNIDATLAMLRNEKNLAAANYYLMESLMMSLVSDKAKITELLSYASEDTMGAALIYQLLIQHDEKTVRNVEHSIINYLRTHKSNEPLRYNIALATLAARIQSDVSNNHSSLIKALKGGDDKLVASSRVNQILDVINSQISAPVVDFHGHTYFLLIAIVLGVSGGALLLAGYLSLAAC